MLMFRGVSFFLVTEMTYFVAYEKFLLLFVEHKVAPKSDALNLSQVCVLFLFCYLHSCFCLIAFLFVFLFLFLFLFLSDSMQTKFV